MLRQVRRIDIGKNRAGTQRQRETQERYFVRLVTNHPQFSVILASLKEGVAMSEIARNFAMNNLLDVNEKTFSEALRVFRRKHPELIEKFEVGGLEFFSEFDANRPHLDTLGNLHQLLRFQKYRLSMLHKHERTTSMPFTQTAKEIEMTVKILETMAKVEGKLNEAGHFKQSELTPEVQENLEKLQKEEGARNRLHGLVSQLVKA